MSDLPPATDSAPTAPPERAVPPRRGVRGAAVLFGGGVAAQGLSFVRNLLLARLLTERDFGIAATFALAMSLLEMLGDLSVDKLLVQAKDGDAPRVQTTAQAVQALRGACAAALLFVSAGLVADLFGAPQAAWAYRVLALVPFVNGLLHLDVRRWQRSLRFGPGTAVDVAPQLVATLAAVPLVLWLGDYRAVLWTAVLQVTTGVVLSHVLAERRYGWRRDPEVVRRILAFGWPLVVNALLMIAIFQGDRVVVGTSYGLVELGAYSLAFSIAFVPTSVLARVATPLVLPVLARVQDDRAAFVAATERSARLLALTVALVTVPLAVAGGPLLAALFPGKYEAAATVLPWLAAMQGVRILRIAPVLAAMARADTLTSMWSNVWRSGALVAMALAAAAQAALPWIAAAGLGGELVALAYSARRLRARHGVPALATLGPSAVALAGIGAAVAVAGALPAHAGAVGAGAVALALTAGAAAALLLVYPEIRASLRGLAPAAFLRTEAAHP